MLIYANIRRRVEPLNSRKRLLFWDGPKCTLCRGGDIELTYFCSRNMTRARVTKSL